MPAALRAILAAAPLALGACAPTEVIKPYRIEIQQGNYISQEMVSQLKVGMSREQVRFVLGTPLVTDIFHTNRWDYIYYRELGRGKREQRALAVFFEDGKLVRLAGDIVPAAPGAARPEAAPASATSPASQKPAEKPQAAPDKPEAAAPAEGEQKPAAKTEERGFFGRMLEKIGF
jgi:outer membrane protein assembly factor BamE